MRRQPRSEPPPMVWGKTTLDAEQQAAVELMRRQLWRRGIRHEPLFSRMAFQFAAVLCMDRASKRKENNDGSG